MSSHQENNGFVSPNFSVFRRDRCFHLSFPGLLGSYLDPVAIVHAYIML
uniref:Rps12 n=2 Tax=Pinus subgen. Strobus TaxID=139272 RepID=D2CNG6_PINBU|nr:ORF48e [Pinus koraiensis]ABP35462.1 ORF48e [Pinus koraiensis]ACB38031.1 Rps12 [Pinus bungeana]